MFQNYSETYASQITALAGFLVILARVFNLEIADSDIVFVAGVVANFAGVIWGIVHRYSRGDISPLGRRL